MSTYRVAGIKDVRIGYVDTGVVVYEDVPFGNKFTMSTAVQNITYEGDNTTVEIFSSADLSGTLGADKLSDTLLEKIYDKTAATGLSGIDKRLYFGEDAEFVASPVELKVTLAAMKDSVSPAVARDIVIRVWKANLKPYKAGDAGNRAKQTFELEWTAEKTTTDIAGGALTGVPTDGCTYSIDFMST